MELKDVKKAIVMKQHVIYQDIEYYVTGYMLRLSNNKLVHLVELHDIRANSVTSGELEKVKIKE